MPLSKTETIIWSAAIGFLFIGLTYVLGMVFGIRIFMLLHIFPWGIGFSGGDDMGIYLYYIFFFLIVFGGIYGIQRMFQNIKPKSSS